MTIETDLRERVYVCTVCVCAHVCEIGSTALTRPYNKATESNDLNITHTSPHTLLNMHQINAQCV